ncbi:MAG: hypothetical protein WDO73_07760 [Ignavibacteriota bacterium]
MQHVANQIGVAFRLFDQRSVQEQLFRTEKLAAVGRLISGVVDELQTPLSSIPTLLAERSTKPGGSAPNARWRPSPPKRSAPPPWYRA